MAAHKSIPHKNLPGSSRRKEPEGSATSGIPRHWEGIVGPEGADRADRYVAEVLGILSRSQIKARGAVIRLAGKEIKVSRELSPGDRLSVDWTEEPAPGLVPEDIPLDILYEDEAVVVVNKPQGMVTHPGHGNRRGTLANALAGRFGVASRAAGVSPPSTAQDPYAALRGFIVHRLDKDTSGVIVAAKGAEAQAFLAQQFRDRSVRKEYIAITRGIPPELSGRIENRLTRDRKERKRFCVSETEGRLSVTDYRVLAAWDSVSGRIEGRGGGGGTKYALVALRPRTGRTHQLRVHMQYLGCPILGDPVYGKADAIFPEATLMLHAQKLRILLPGHREPDTFRAPVPARFRRLVAVLERVQRGKLV